MLMVLLRQPACPETPLRICNSPQSPCNTKLCCAVLSWGGTGGPMLGPGPCFPQPCLHLTPLSLGRNVSMLVSAGISESCFPSGTQACLELCYYSNIILDFFCMSGK